MHRQHLARRAGISSLLLFAACSDGGPKSIQMQAKLRRTAGGSAGANLAVSAARTSDVNITSLKVPFWSMQIQNDAAVDNTAGASPATTMAYTCPATTNDGCLLELTGTELTDRLQAVSKEMTPGTYNWIGFSSCDPSGTGTQSSFTAYITATVQLKGTTYYTKSNPAVALSASGPAEALPVAMNGCARNYRMATPLVIAESTLVTIPFSAYYDLRDVAYASVATAPDDLELNGNATCMPANQQYVPQICLHFLDVGGTTSTKAPKVERYLLNNSVILSLFVDPETNKPFGAYWRRKFTENANTAAPFIISGPIDSVVVAADGSLRLAKRTTNQTLQTGSIQFIPSFKREAHSGTLTLTGGATVNYTATIMP